MENVLSQHSEGTEATPLHSSCVSVKTSASTAAATEETHASHTNPTPLVEASQEVRNASASTRSVNSKLNELGDAIANVRLEVALRRVAAALDCGAVALKVLVIDTLAALLGLFLEEIIVSLLWRIIIADVLVPTLRLVCCRLLLDGGLVLLGALRGGACVALGGVMKAYRIVLTQQYDPSDAPAAAYVSTKNDALSRMFDGGVRRAGVLAEREAGAVATTTCSCGSECRKCE